MNFQVSLPPTVTLTEMEGKLVLFSKKTGDFFGLNESAAFFIQELIKSDLQSTVEKASKTFSAPQEELLADISTLVAELETLGLLKKYCE